MCRVIVNITDKHVSLSGPSAQYSRHDRFKTLQPDSVYRGTTARTEIRVRKNLDGDAASGLLSFGEKGLSDISDRWFADFRFADNLPSPRLKKVSKVFPNRG